MDIRYLILVLTTRCNLRCRYCYCGESEWSADMSVAVMQQAVGLAGAAGLSFHLQLTGGEPTLVPSLIETAADLALKTGRCHTIGIQTNGTCLTRNILTIFQRYGMQVGVSLDGPPQVHQNERGMAAQTLRGLQLLESVRIPFWITTVVTQANSARLDELVLILAGYSMARGIGLDLLVSKGRAQKADGVAPADRPALEKGLQRMRATLDAVNARRAVPIQWREWDLLFPADGRRERRSGFCHASLAQSLAVTADGRIFPCTQTLDDERFAAGTVWQPRCEALSRLKTCHEPPASCAACEVNAVCPGDCPSRLYYNQNSDPAPACKLYRALYRLGHSTLSNNFLEV
jgi:uncharacterized protein